MLTVNLLGELGKRFGRRHRFDVRSPAEAVRALCANFPDFMQFVLTSTERHVGYRVLSGRDEIGVDELHHPASRQITIAPVILGASGLSKVIIGAVILYMAFQTGGVSLGAQGLTYASLGGQVAFAVGVSLVLGGVSQLLAPAPDAPPPNDAAASFVFDGPVNTQAQGNPVPVGYGRLIVGSAVISAGLTVDEIVA